MRISVHPEASVSLDTGDEVHMTAKILAGVSQEEVHIGVG